ncbi:MAG: hypothetical protein NDJ90_06550 [Oligoflexia bacterium]|nr:hypothetical protein [Oligoflexia bacterium]
MKPTEFKDGDVVVARYIPAALAWKDGLNFFSNDPDFIQVGTWSYPADKVLLAHTHNEVKREVDLTQEVLYIRKGSIRADIYDLKLAKMDEQICREGDVMVLLRGGHGYQILENGTQVLEIKNGPYVGAERDRRRF